MKIGARTLDLWLNKSFGSSWPKSFFQIPDPWVKIYLNILGVHLIFLWILDKKNICLGKLEVGFWTLQGLIQKDNVDIRGKKGAQISVSAAKKIVTRV